MNRLRINPEPEILTVDEAAKFLRVGCTTVRAICASKRLPHMRIGQKPGSGAIRIMLADLREFARQSTECAA
jgi:excisionase family DNA binding protein